MRTLSYTPSVEAYAKVQTGPNSYDYLDLTRDIVSCSVSIVSNGASSASIELVNESDKYDGVFEPMDAIAIFASKGDERRRLFTGYITKIGSGKAKTSSVDIQCKDIIYRLQNLYWDKGLDSSQMAMGHGGYMSTFEEMIVALLHDVGGVPTEQIFIDDEIPQEVQSLAMRLYAGQRDDAAELRDMQESFYDVLMSTGLTISGTIESGDYYGETQGASAGKTIEIPQSVSQSGIYTITPYQKFSWAYDQGKVFRKWKEQGSRFSDHIAVINAGGSDRLLIACTTTFGWNGDMLDFYLEGGIVLRTIMADAKSAGDANYSTWGHVTGGTTNVIEFEIDADFWDQNHWNPGTHGWHEDWAGKRVLKVKNLGSIL